MSKKFDPTDIVGQKYGKLTVMGFAEKRNKDYYYFCKCDCGNEITTLRRSLLQGKSKSCGCSRRAESRSVDIIGGRFGKLVVLGIEGVRGKGTMYRCRCDCGKEAVKCRGDLIHGYTKTCGDCTSIEKEDDHYRYYCTNGDSFTFDECDLELIQRYRWIIQDGYPATVVEGKNYKLARLILDAGEDDLIDHIDGITRDARRSNLRFASHSENNQNAAIYKNNTSGYKGVSYHKRKNKFGAYICYHKKLIKLGYFDTPEEAARAYDEAARFYFGEFACVNFPLPGEQGCRRNLRRLKSQYKKGVTNQWDY